MTKPPDKFTGVPAFPITLSAALISLLAILLAPGFQPVPNPSSPTTTAKPVTYQAIVTAGASICDNQEKRSVPVNGNFPNSSDSASDIDDDDDGGLDDLNADSSSGYDQDTVLFSMIGLGAMALPKSAMVLFLLFPARCSYCPHEHIRERAPPREG